MITATFSNQIKSTLAEIKSEGLFKNEHPITSSQDALVTLEDGREVLNMCANNYLGLANHPVLREAARDALDNFGFGTASVRFICGTQSIHQELEKAISAFLGTEDTILYPSCFDAFSKPFSGPKTPSSPTRSITPRSSMASASAKPSASATPIMTSLI